MCLIHPFWKNVVSSTLGLQNLERIKTTGSGWSIRSLVCKAHNMGSDPVIAIVLLWSFLVHLYYWCTKKLISTFSWPQEISGTERKERKGQGSTLEPPTSCEVLLTDSTPVLHHKIHKNSKQQWELRSKLGSFTMLMPFPARISQTIHPAPKFFGLHHSHDCRWWGARSKVVFSPLCAIGAGNGAPSGDNVKKRKIAEHIILLRTNPNISDAEEKDMLDYLYTCQYQMRGILTVSLGRIEDPNSENFTHAVFMRFQQKEDIAKFQSSAYYSKVLDGYVKPVSYVRLTMAWFL